jgi:hypothetical protein
VRLQNSEDRLEVKGEIPPGLPGHAATAAEPATASKWPGRTVALLAGSVLLVAVGFRLYALGRLPGINGDEAWYGLQVARLLNGDPVEWRTPNLNLPGPLQLGLLLLLLLFLPRSFTALRLPSVISSLAQMALTYWVAKRHFDRVTAAIALLLTAALPINIAYARFGWDPSHSGLIAIVATHFALSGNVWASALAFTFALLVQPTNVFIAPFLVAVLLGVENTRIGLRGAALRTALHVALLSASLGVLKLTSATSTTWAARNLTGEALTRVADPSQWSESAVLYSRLLSGDSVYQYVVGTGYGTATIDLLVWLTLVGVSVAGGLALRTRTFGREAGVVVGWVGSLLSFFILAGPEAMRPESERYAVCLLVPTTLAVSVLLRHAFERMARVLPLVAAGLAATLALASFGTHYLAELRSRGSSSHQTFWTGAVEPKEEAFQRIASDAQNRETCVVADTWWVYWPLAYLAQGSHLQVAIAGQQPPTLPPGGIYWVGFPGGPFDRVASTNAGALPRWDIESAGARTALRVWWTPPLQAR